MSMRCWVSAFVAPMLLAAAPAPDVPAWPDLKVEVDAAKAAMLNTPQAALAFARRAQAAALRHPASPDRERALATAGWLEGEALIRVNRPAEATPVIDAALARARTAAPAGKLEGDLLKARGSAAAAQERVQPALADFQAAYRVYQHADIPRSEALVLQEIGRIYSDARDYPHSVRYYEQSTELLKHDPSLTLAVRNNLGWDYLGLGRNEEALGQFAMALKLARSTDSRLMTVRVLPNLALAQMRTGRLTDADATLAQAFQLAHSDADTRAGELFIWDAKAQLDVRRGRTAAARDDLERAFAGQDLSRTDARFSEAHATAWRVYSALGQPDRALAHLTAYKRLDDQARDLAASTNAALMGAQFDFANQDLKIERLRSEKLQRDVALEQSRARFQSMVLWTVLVAAGLGLGVVLAGLIGMRRSRDAVRSVNRRLETTNDALERALQAKSQFLATTSHEIRTPLNGVLGMTQVLLADRTLTPAVRGRVELVHGAGETMRALVDDILDLAKMETGRIAVDKRPMDLERLLEDVVRLWRGEAQTKGLTLTLDCEGAPGWIVEDATRLRQVLFNLLANATKFTDAGEVALRVRVREGRVGFAVSDTGLGIGPADLERVFEPFTQVDGGTTRRHGGTGLGLAICRDVARALGGDVVLESRLGEGSTFRLDLPLTVAEPTGCGAAAGPGRAASLSEARVLVVEPNPLARAVLRTVMAGATAQVQAVGDLPAALAELAAGGCTHVLAAGEALGADPQAALEACRALSRAAAPAGVTLLLTGAPPEEAQALVAAGAAKVLDRPIAPERLLAALREAVAEADPPTALAA